MLQHKHENVGPWALSLIGFSIAAHGKRIWHWEQELDRGMYDQGTVHGGFDDFLRKGNNMLLVQMWIGETRASLEHHPNSEENRVCNV